MLANFCLSWGSMNNGLNKVWVDLDRFVGGFNFYNGKACLRIFIEDFIDVSFIVVAFGANS